MENQKNDLVRIYERLRYEGKVSTKQEFAALLEVNYSNLSSAMNGNPRCYTKKMVARAQAVAERLLSGDPAPAPTPPREVTVSPDLLNIIATQAETIRSQQEVIARLTGVETKKGAV